MTRILITRHGFLLAIAILVGVCTSLPQIFAISSLGTEWAGIYPVNNDDEMYYLARSQEIRDGNLTIAQPYLADGKDNEALQFWLPDFIVAKTGLILSISAPATFILFDFLFPSLLFLLSYTLAYHVLGKQRNYALIYALLFNTVLFFDWFSRPISPQFTLIPLLLFLIFVWLSTMRANWVWVLLAGLSLGVLFHFYTYYWTFAVVFIGLLGAWQLLQKRFKELVQSISIFAIGLVIGIPYFIHFTTIMRLPEYDDTLWRLGMLNTHFPSGLVVFVLGGMFLLFLGMILWKQRSITNTQLFIGLSILAGLVVTNHHVITGKNLEFSSHYFIPAMIGIALCGLYLIWYIGTKFLASIRHTNMAASLLGVVSVFAVTTVTGFFTTYSQPQPDFIADQRFGSTISYINESLGPERIIFANSKISALIPAYSSQHVFYAREANLHFMSNEEVMNRFLLQNSLEKEFTKEDLILKEREVFGTHYINQSSHFNQRNKLYNLIGREPINYERYPSVLISSLLHQWNEIKSVNLIDALQAYNVTHVVWDTVADPNWQIDRLGELKLLHENRGVRLYEL